MNHEKLLDMTQIAKHYGVTRQAVHHWKVIGWLPEPVVVFGRTPVWSIEQIEELGSKYIKQSRVFKNKEN